eukprot:TRINITY_DN4254_c0_g1_i2.p2 TRINITY_DN4254_c0_g1~~TRINITY_DN4254_c0_g1_i2.p2  ORF type:complete len:153 (+),score=25.72 TRINITY_DN4254_c0_g1_i2:121-579(+)
MASSPHDALERSAAVLAQVERELNSTTLSQRHQDCADILSRVAVLNARIPELQARLQRLSDAKADLCREVVQPLRSVSAVLNEGHPPPRTGSCSDPLPLSDVLEGTANAQQKENDDNSSIKQSDANDALMCVQECGWSVFLRMPPNHAMLEC